MGAIFTEHASEQLASIVSYIAQASPQNARRFLERIENAVEMLDNNPRLGPERQDLTDGAPYVRTWPVPPVVIVYRERVDGGAEVVVVAHGRQLLQALLEDLPGDLR
jgi:plasmid stabilization system protein ParE